MYDLWNFPHTRTYDDDLGWLIVIVKKLNSDYDDLKSRIAAMEDAYNNIDPKIDAAIAKMQAIIDGELADITNQVNKQLADIQNQVNDKMVEVDAKMVKLQKQITTAINEMKALVFKLEGIVLALQKEIKKYIDESQTELYYNLIDYLDEKLEEYSGKMNSLSPIYGRIENTDKVLQDIYSFTGFPLQARWLDAVGITAKELDNLKIPAKHYDTNLAWYIRKWFRRKNNYGKMSNPFNGYIMDVRQVINSIVDKMQTWAWGVKAQEFDAKKITAQQLDDLHIKAYEFDWERKWFDDIIVSNSSTDMDSIN